MGNSIFDWDDEEEKQEFERPAEVVDHRLENAWENARQDDPWKELAVENHEIEQSPEIIFYRPEPPDETARRGGLAWSAGIAFFSSIVFMLFLGWGADQILGSSPWGIVAGIVLGSIIGFIQFFRISSQIFNSAKAESEMRPLMPRDDDEKYR